MSEARQACAVTVKAEAAAKAEVVEEVVRERLLTISQDSGVSPVAQVQQGEERVKSSKEEEEGVKWCDERERYRQNLMSVSYLAGQEQP